MENITEIEIKLDADDTAENWAIASRAKMQRLTNELTGVTQVGDMLAEYELHTLALNHQKKILDDRHKELVKKLDTERLKWLRIYEQGTRQVVQLKGEQVDAETGTVILDLQTLEQTKNATLQLKIEWQEYAEEYAGI